MLKQQSDDIATDDAKHQTLQKMVQLAYDMRDELQNNNVDAFGDILHENWMLKEEHHLGNQQRHSSTTGMMPPGVRVPVAERSWRWRWRFPDVVRSKGASRCNQGSPT
ncbi:hypothetical protein ACTMU2_39190 [Cupriavidus basilensis]